MMKCKVIRCKEQAVFGDGYCREHHQEIKRISLFSYEKDKGLKEASDIAKNEKENKRRELSKLPEEIIQEEN